MKTLKIKQAHAAKIKKGYPLILKEAVLSKDDDITEGSLIGLTDEKGGFLGKGYYGVQNKGIGWVLTQNRDEPIDQRFFLSRLTKAFQERNELFGDSDTTAFRVFNGEGDGIGGLTIDYYDGYFLIQWYSKGIYAYKESVVTALDELSDYKAIYEKKRFSSAGQYVEDDDFVKGTRGEFPIIVKENGIHFAVYLNDGAMTGVFLDQRNVRKAIRDRYAEGKTVLNTFSYTGAFSVAAALGGAAKTTSVDVANRSLNRTIEQFSVNGLDHEAHDIKVMDVFNYFSYAVKKQLSYDLVILDPPSFARTKKRTFSAAKDYKNLLKETIAITKNEGVIVASTNSSAFGMKKFKGFIDAACKETGTSCTVLEEYSLPEDFKTVKSYQEGNYLKVVFLRIHHR
ncbi:class I SAM-dependent rRNA methyltransferase [Bacillus glycinifermentans]|mgnify:CR=1 FL=1|uniref:50S rRNA methyltransferase n=1 Tax=Bacillus glycinifermentans TaxID=1664069 RepID=A0A0T6BJV7_9BACI|nr:class I SAM-dependent rRNA methyltransferase [Bacillus glycinifermentans]ATH93677.1 class I SAM-dependent rRNA methyltransferase [Bacillus glycinifermentans]KRT90147.1 50S rRNA methyltransferase [Bacillus glycinifermentans]MEC0483833.1 class I SAM-dependent rRNA methyltransferase [Bacillus glycinifermentans]MEC0496327.1 class I SAM-dependent rRNA methyltransferase [Bacillus glycinifermentans]MEC0539380.1 class I SAM-dependent rRNA methyltransferase [Bacillus glycinifermentans]